MQRAVDACIGQHDAGHTANGEQEDEADSPQHGCRNSIDPPHMVAIQEKILTPVGTAMTIVAAHKVGLRVTAMPTVYMWCAQTMKPTTPIATMA